MKKSNRKFIGILLVVVLFLVYSNWDEIKERSMGEQVCVLSPENRSTNAHLSELPQPTIEYISADVPNNTITWEMKILNSEFPIGWYIPSGCYYGDTILKIYIVPRLKVSSNITLVYDNDRLTYKKRFTTELFSGTQTYGTYTLTRDGTYLAFSAGVSCYCACTIPGATSGCGPYVGYRVPANDTSQPSWVGNQIVLNSPYISLEITDFQTQQIDDGNFNKIKVSFNTTESAIATYKLKGYTKHTETSYTKHYHNYTYTVTPYINANYEIIVSTLESQTKNKSGTIRTYGPEICTDGLDNDGDGLVDMEDTEDCYAIAIQKLSETVEAERWYAVFNITGNVNVKIDYQKGGGTTDTKMVTGVGTEYAIELTSLDPSSTYNYIVSAEDKINPAVSESYQGSFTTSSGVTQDWIEIIEKSTTQTGFKIKFKINETSFTDLTFTYKEETGTPQEATYTKWGDTYTIEEALPAGNYEFIISIVVSGATKEYEDSFIIEAPPITTPPPYTTPPITSTPPPSGGKDYTLYIVAIIIIGIVVYYFYTKKKKPPTYSFKI